MPNEVKPLRPRAPETSPVDFTRLEAASATDWLQDRAPSILSTNAGTRLAAFQAWRNFKEAFAPELVGQAFEETSKALGRPIARSLDPFGGSGTTALASQFLGAFPTTVEVNPYLADLIEAKLARYNVQALLSDYELVLETAKDVETDHFPGSPNTFVEPGRRDRYIFSAAVAARIAALRVAILALKDQDNRRLLRVLLSSMAIEVSNVVVSGKGRRYRRNWAERQATPRQVMDLFDDAFVRAVYDIGRFHNRACRDYKLLRGDARLLTPDTGDYDVSIFSPPYPNSFDYTDVYNVELWVGGYLDGREANTTLRCQTLRSHVQIHRSYATEMLASKRLEEVIGELGGVRDKLWNRSIPDMVKAYFGDMNTIMARLAGALVSGGRAYLVVGDSRYHGVQVSVADILIELATPLGFEKIADEPFRSMRASPQQGGRQELVESLITLRRL
jgi:hypothetical protein